jgi:hypothetical protein
MQTQAQNIFSRGHGSLFDRGSADAYYGRPADPHYIPAGGNASNRVTVTSDAEVAEYQAGYDAEDGRKDWG